MNGYAYKDMIMTFTNLDSPQYMLRILFSYAGKMHNSNIDPFKSFAY